MTEALRTIKLSGELAREFGPVHRLAIASPAEAIRALCALFPRFERWLIDSEQRGVGYRVINARTVVAELAHLHHPTGERAEVRIVPVLTGSKSALGQILLGAAIIGAAFLTGGASLGVIGLTTTGFGSMALSIGTSLIFGGIGRMLTPTPAAQGPQERPENTPSSQFNGAVNTTSQGQPVPIGYGRLIVGSAVISAGITAQEAAL